MQTANRPVFDETRSERFAERLLDAFNGGALSLMVSIGHRTGLFDTLDGMSPADSATIARTAKLDERYVREWLGAMTTGGIIELTADSLYYLPPEHAAWLCRSSTEDNMAVFSQYIGELGKIEGDIVECFRNGGGVPYSRYERFHELMAEDSGQSVLPVIESHILNLESGLSARLEEGIDVLDCGCGRGKALLKLAERFPDSRFTGYDLSAEATEHAQREARERGLDNITFEQRDLSDFNATATPARFDLVFTFDAVHDQAKPLHLLQGIRRTLKTDGVYIMQDIHAHSHVHDNLDHPLGTLLYTVSCMHCMTVSLAQGGDGLGAMWGREKAMELLQEAGFTDIRIERFEHDIQNDWYVIHP